MRGRTRPKAGARLDILGEPHRMLLRLLPQLLSVRVLHRRRLRSRLRRLRQCRKGAAANIAASSGSSSTQLLRARRHWEVHLKANPDCSSSSSSGCKEMANTPGKGLVGLRQSAAACGALSCRLLFCTAPVGNFLLLLQRLVPRVQQQALLLDACAEGYA